MIFNITNKKFLCIMCGIPGSGKSTFTKKILKEVDDSIVISRDTIRFNLVSENEPYFSKEKLVYKTFIQDIDKALEKHRVVVADATHITKASRKKLINSLHLDEDTKIVCICIRPHIDTVIERNELRKGTRSYVPVEVIKDMDSKIEEPELDEGFYMIEIERDFIIEKQRYVVDNFHDTVS